MIGIVFIQGVTCIGCAVAGVIFILMHHQATDAALMFLFSFANLIQVCDNYRNLLRERAAEAHSDYRRRKFEQSHSKDEQTDDD